MKGIIFQYMLMYAILGIDMKLKICLQKRVFFLVCFSIVHILINIVLGNLKSRLAVDEIHVERQLSQNLVSVLDYPQTTMSSIHLLSFKCGPCTIKRYP